MAIANFHPAAALVVCFLCQRPVPCRLFSVDIPALLPETHRPLMALAPCRRYDFHQEFSGWPVLSVRGAAGTIVRMTPSELLDANGVPDQVFGPAYWEYTLRGAGQLETYRPRFFTYGFRYLHVNVIPGGGVGKARFIQATGGDTNVYYENVALNSKHHVGFCDMCGISICDELMKVTQAYVANLTTGANFTCTMLPAGNATLVSIQGEFVYSSAPIVGNFTCSNPLYNRIHHMILEAMKSNLVGIFTDCPHRERLGWLEQSWLLAKSVGHNFDLSTLYPKIAGDMAEAQLDSGMVPDIAPEYTVFSGGFRDSPEWGWCLHCRRISSPLCQKAAPRHAN